MKPPGVGVLAMRNVKPASALMLALLSGCSFIPAYNRPALPVTDQYPVAGGGSGPAAADIGWKQFFADPALQGLIALSLANNRNLRVSVLNVQEAQAQYRIDRASLFPAIDGAAELDRTPYPRQSQQRRAGRGCARIQPGGPGGFLGAGFVRQDPLSGAGRA